VNEKKSASILLLATNVISRLKKEVRLTEKHRSQSGALCMSTKQGQLPRIPSFIPVWHHSAVNLGNGKSNYIITTKTTGGERGGIYLPV
jgi:hypothetical protein